MFYQLLFSGEIKEGYDAETVKKDFGKCFKISEKQVDYLFSGQMLTIKRKLTQSDALQYVLKMDDIGAVSYVDNMPEDELPPGITEDRRKGERRILVSRRRTVRCGMQPDRRVNPGRRKGDRRQHQRRVEPDRRDDNREDSIGHVRRIQSGRRNNDFPQ